MANRSYLYNIDFNRLERAKTKEDKVFGISEYAYEIPLSYKILLSENPINTYSIIWDYEHPIAIAGSSKGGKQKLFDFLNRLKEMNLYDSQYLNLQITKTETFFSENVFNRKYFFLEGGELYQMDETPFEKQNLKVYQEVESIDKTIEAFFAKVQSINQEINNLEIQRNKMTPKRWFKKPKFILDESQRNSIQKKIQNKVIMKQELLGIDNWSTILYFHFGE